MTRLTRLALFPALLATGVAFAGSAGSRWLGTISLDEWTLVERNGAPALCDLHVSSVRYQEMKVTPLRDWEVSAPTMIGRDGLRLFADPTGDGSTLRLTKEKVTGPDWTFEVVSTLKPKYVTWYRDRTKRRSPDGEEGFLFKARVADGPKRGWYLSAEPAPPAPAPEDPAVAVRNEPAFRALKLVPDEKSACVFKFLKANHWVK